MLAALTPLYRLALALRERRLASGREPVRRLRFPVISIGNLSTGGAGKTPFVIALAQALTAGGLAVDVLSRGYGRRSQDSARVDPNGSAEEFGDEPLLIARQAEVPVYVASQRYDAGVLAERGAEGMRVHILDDGFQHRQLHRDIDILLLNRHDWHGHLLPAGDLREPLQAIKRADVITIPAGEPELETRLRAFGWQGPIWRLHRRMEVPASSGPVIAFCGIARPEQFCGGLVAGGMQVTACKAFPDHHRYTRRDLDQLAALARRNGARSLITTEKDAVRLTGLVHTLPILTAPLRVEIGDTQAALDYLLDRIHRCGQLP
jgi:tetraacyldisaccharide 4'-kinase